MGDVTNVVKQLRKGVMNTLGLDVPDTTASDKAQNTPPPQDVAAKTPLPEMPTAGKDDATVRAERRRSIADMRRRRGRASTILTEQDELG